MQRDDLRRITPAGVDLRPRARPERPLALRCDPQNVTLDLARSAFVVIDLQNDFVSPGGWVDVRGVNLDPLRAVFGPVNRAAKLFRAADVPVLWLNWGNRPDRLNLNPGVLHTANPKGEGWGYGDMLPSGRGPMLEKGGWGAAIAPELDVQPGDLHVDKYRLSGFWDNELDSVLRNLGIRTLFYAGVNLDRCVFATMMDASFAGYDNILLADCSATVSPSFCNEATHYLIRALYGYISDTERLGLALG